MLSLVKAGIHIGDRDAKGRSVKRTLQELPLFCQKSSNTNGLMVFQETQSRLFFLNGVSVSSMTGDYTSCSCYYNKGVDYRIVSAPMYFTWLNRLPKKCGIEKE